MHDSYTFLKLFYFLYLFSHQRIPQKISFTPSLLTVKSISWENRLLWGFFVSFFFFFTSNTKSTYNRYFYGFLLQTFTRYNRFLNEPRRFRNTTSFPFIFYNAHQSTTSNIVYKESCFPLGRFKNTFSTHSFVIASGYFGKRKIRLFFSGSKGNVKTNSTY